MGLLTRSRTPPPALWIIGALAILAITAFSGPKPQSGLEDFINGAHVSQITGVCQFDGAATFAIMPPLPPLAGRLGA